MVSIVQIRISVFTGDGIRLIGGEIGRVFKRLIGGMLVTAAYEGWVLSIVSWIFVFPVCRISVCSETAFLDSS